jgi:hypothetical protein
MASVVVGDESTADPIRSGMAISRRMKWLMVGCGILFSTLWGTQVIGRMLSTERSFDFQSGLFITAIICACASYVMVLIRVSDWTAELQESDDDELDVSPLDSSVVNLSYQKAAGWMMIACIAFTFLSAIEDFQLLKRFNGLLAITPLFFPSLFGTQKPRLRILESGLLFIGPVNFTLYPWGTIKQVEFKHLERSDLVRITAADSKKKTVEQEILLVKPDEERWRELQRVIGERVGVVAGREAG